MNLYRKFWEEPSYDAGDTFWINARAGKIRQHVHNDVHCDRSTIGIVTADPLGLRRKIRNLTEDLYMP